MLPQCRQLSTPPHSTWNFGMLPLEQIDALCHPVANFHVIIFEKPKHQDVTRTSQTGRQLQGPTTYNSITVLIQGHSR